ncbi:PilN domain-containing protein [candidate division WOR-3 bacterium]|nr:PilN domain-containing protein [candidate division WOR-3 bacterium]
MLNRQFLSIVVLPDSIKLGKFCIKNNILHVLDLQTFESQEKLKEYLNKKRLKNLAVIGSLGGVHVIARSITLSSIGQVDFDKEILKNIQEHIPTSVKDENVLIKFQILSTKYDKAKETVDVLVAVAKENAVITFLEYIRGLNLIPLIVDAGNTSLFLPFIEKYEKKVSTSVVNINNNSTDIVIVENGFPYFVSKIDNGWEDFSNSKAEFFQRLSSVFDFYHSGRGRRKRIHKIIVTGKNDNEVKKFLEKKFDFPVKTSDFGTNSLLRFHNKFENVSSYAHIIGLGLKRVYPALFEIDLIPDQEKENLKFNLLKRTLKRTTVLFFFILSFGSIIILSTNLFYSIRVYIVSKKVEGIKPKLNEVYELSSKNKTLVKKLSDISPLIKNEVVWDKVLFEISKLTPEEVWLISVKSNNILKKGDGETIIKEKILYLEGETTKQSKIDRFVSKLEDSPLFKSIQIDKIEKKEHISFKVKLSLR